MRRRDAIHWHSSALPRSHCFNSSELFFALCVLFNQSHRKPCQKCLRGINFRGPIITEREDFRFHFFLSHSSGFCSKSLFCRFITTNNTRYIPKKRHTRLEMRIRKSDCLATERREKTEKLRKNKFGSQKKKEELKMSVIMTSTVVEIACHFEMRQWFRCLR